MHGDEIISLFAPVKLYHVRKVVAQSIILLAGAVLLISCFGAGGRKEEKVDLVPIRVSDYELSVPSYMKEGDLNEDASLQFQNIFRETYVIVIDEGKQEIRDVYLSLNEYDTTRSAVDNYTNIQLSLLHESMAIDSLSEIQSLTVNNLEARQVELIARVEGVSKDIYYLLTFVEGDSNVYMIMSWTLADRKEKYSNTFKKMAKTFKLR